ncbi:HD domain-containing protein [Halonatronum saccharophilum]|uniref:HD domain-containing protein n=1 Tax=Halonatronum saccharophilum TaxID=150060 RepID=UPI00047F2927|nr:HD domain-containing protein [Halonatronum saccharophilum]
MKEKVFKDPVHGFVYVYEPLILELIDSKEMQRLRRVKQLGLSYLTYHGGEHSRFAHSLGTYEVTRRILEGLDKKGQLFLSKKEQLLALTSALLHDLGHSPFSHSLEGVFSLRHEAWTNKIILGDTQVNKVLSKVGSNFPKEVTEVIKGIHSNKLIIDLISSQIDADRTDYLLRDSKAIGVSYGNFDLERIIRVMVPTKDGIFFRKEGMHSIEAYILARYSMYWQVYFHPTSRSGEIILRNLFKRAKALYKSGEDICLPNEFTNLFEDKLLVKDYLNLDDSVLFFLFQKWTSSSDIILSDLSSRILNRSLFKRIEVDSNDDDLYSQLSSLLVEAGINPEYYLELDCPSDISYDYYQPNSNHKKNPIYLVDKRGEKVELSQISDPVRAVAGKRVRYNIYYPRDLIEKVEGLAERFKNLLDSYK